MIEVLPFNKTLFNDFTLDTKKLTKYIYINDIQLISNLMAIDLPIKNKKLALRNIFDFLTYLEFKMDEEGETLIQIPSSILIEYFNRDEYKKYMKILENINILTKVPYEDGTFYKAPFNQKNKGDKWNKIEKKGICMQYRIHNEYINKEDLAIIILEDDRSKNTFVNEVENLDERYINTIKKLRIDIPKAIEAEIKYFQEKNLTIPNLRKRISRIFYTERKRFIKKGKKVDRIYHSFTNVSRVSRKHLNINMKDIDVVNCQPLLMVAELKRTNMDYDINYKSDCEEGCFYERFYDINRKKGISDEEHRIPTKVAIYKNIFFGFNKISKHNKRFKELYPETWLSLEKISLEENSLAQRLQNLESKLFNNLIPEKSKYYFTLFDAIYFDNILDKYKLEKIVKDYFSQYEIKVQIK